MITGHSSKSYKFQKRTVWKDYWKWLTEKRKTQFRNAVFGLFEGYHMENRQLVFDEAEIMALVDTGGWGSDFGLALKNWAKKPMTPRHIRATLKLFYDWGTQIFEEAKYPIVPKMPDFSEFLAGLPWKKPSRKKRLKK